MVAIVCGIEFGGTTLLLDCLKAHPSVWADFEIGLLDAEDRTVEAFGLWCAGHPQFRSLAKDWGITREEVESLALEPSWEAVYDRLFGLLLARSGEEGRTLLVDKKPSYSLILPTIRERLPSAPVVIVVRDPRAVYASWLKRPHRRVGIRRFAAHYRRCMATAMIERGRGSSCLLIRHEDLVLDPVEVMATVSRHLGLAEAPRPLLPSNASRQHPKTRYTFPTDRGNARRVDRDGIDRAALDEYRAQLPEAVQTGIISAIGDDLSWTLYDQTEPVVAL